jgi:hypothetical protein
MFLLCRECTQKRWASAATRCNPHGGLSAQPTSKTTICCEHRKQAHVKNAVTPYVDANDFGWLSRVSAKWDFGLASNLLLGGTHEVQLKARNKYKTNANSFGSLSGVTPKLVSGLACNQRQIWRGNHKWFPLALGFRRSAPVIRGHTPSSINVRDAQRVQPR